LCFALALSLAALLLFWFDPTMRLVAVYSPATHDPSRNTHSPFVDLVCHTGSELTRVGWKVLADTGPKRIDRLISPDKTGDVAVAFLALSRPSLDVFGPLKYDACSERIQRQGAMMRSDGRKRDDLRPVTIECEFTASPSASVLVRAGQTIVWCAASVHDSVPRWMMKEDAVRGWVTAEYNMTPASTSPRARREGRRGSVSGRTHEIQRLIGRSLRAVTDLHALGARTVTLDCEVLQADGGTRTACITGAFVALALALDELYTDGAVSTFPLTTSLSAISCGLVGTDTLLDLCYVEDAAATVDMNVVMTGRGRFVEVQATGEEATFDSDEFAELMVLAQNGINKLTQFQRAALPDSPHIRALFEVS
jgi:ribonuclease PH